MTPRLVALLPFLGLVACTVPPPSGPSVMALPPQGKTLEVFQEDDFLCRGYANHQIGGADPARAGQQAALGSAALGTAAGAGLGMALGSLSGAMGAGAAVGGATGLLMGSAIGANNAQASAGNLQQRYDIAYTQCMYSRGNAVQSAPAIVSPAPAYPYYPSTSVVIGGGWGWGWGGPGYRRWYW